MFFSGHGFASVGSTCPDAGDEVSCRHVWHTAGWRQQMLATPCVPPVCPMATWETGNGG
jgi:hypothetical protein